MAGSGLTLSVPPDFDLWRTVYSHGWCALPPFRIDKDNRTFHRLLRVGDGSLADCAITDGHRELRIVVKRRSLNMAQRNDIKRQLRDCLRLDEDYSEFRNEAKRHEKFRWVIGLRAGRLLRAPTVFEDVVKIICTTNCSWALTEAMVGNLTSKLGVHFEDGLYSFPTPEALAGVPESFIRKEIRAGYRSLYLKEFAEAVASGTMDVESWRHSVLPTEELFRRVRSVKGVGDYAAGNILKLLGRYDYLGLDSWVRGKFYETHHNGRRVNDKTIERAYAPFGKWRGLFFWLEMTRDWYGSKFPF